MRDRAGITDGVAALVNGEPTVKGPDPAVWGTPQVEVEVAAVGTDGVEVKGPDPAVWGTPQVKV